MSEIRQRSTERSSNNNRRGKENEEQQEEKAEKFDPHELGAGLVAKSLIDSSPQHHGVVVKLHVPLLYSILPTFIQQFILNWSFLLAPLSFLFGHQFGPSWKERYLILCGSYLYKYKNRSSSVPKGSPFDIETISRVDVIRTTSNNNSNTINSNNNHNNILAEIGDLPVGYTGIFIVSTLRRKHYYAVSNIEETMIWVRSINDARQEAITRNMGHATNVPYPATWKYFDTLGKSLLKSKTRIKNRVEQYQSQQSSQMEMTEFMGSPAPGGSFPSGYLS